MRRMIVLAVLIVAGLVVALPFMLVERTPRSDDTEETMIRVYLYEDGRTAEMTMTDYLIGAVAAEMPAAFAQEALCAQAVATRTYAAAHMKRYGGTGYRDADISTDHRLHQAYINEEKQREKWGADYDRYHEKICRAVRATAGEVMTYDGKLIRAFYHSMCGGHTASAQEVWDTPLPYLVSVECTWEQDAPRRLEEKKIPFTELAAILGQDAVTMATSADGADVVRIVNRTESGRADLVRIGGQNYAGTQLRTKLGLRSADFSAQASADGIVFTTVGYGHGVGLCQYGAGGMAKEGYSYRDILRHYYRGINIERLR